MKTKLTFAWVLLALMPLISFETNSCLFQEATRCLPLKKNRF